LRSLLLLPVIGACLLLLVSLAHSASTTIDVPSIKPGMKGYGLTVFRGLTPERFDVEVIDVLKNFRPSQDLILVRTPHPILEKANVVAGMSGSPIYLDGKLAGAYAYGWLFGKEPVAGVTPIASMLAELTRPVDPSIWDALGIPVVASAQRKSAAKADAAKRAQLRVREDGALFAAASETPRDPFSALRAHADRHGFGAPLGAGSLPRLAPAATPLMLSGFDERIVDLLDAELARFGMPAVEASAGGAAGATKSSANNRFIDGGAIGVQLMRGDVQATSIGTVTHVAGHKLVAFGHPMMNAGQPALPTATARILHILASEQRSFKIGEVQQPLGTLVHDRQAAIVIDTTLTPSTVPMTVRVHGVPGAPKTEWNIELASHRLLTPMLGFAATMNALGVTAAEQADAVFEAKTRVQIAGHGVREITDYGYTPAGIASPMAISQLRAFDIVGAAYINPFEQARVERIDVELTVKFGRGVVTVIDAVAPAALVDPGKNVDIYATLRRFGQPDETKIISVAIPMSAAGEKIEISLEPGNTVKIEQPRADSLEQIFDNIEAGYAATSLVVSTKLPTQGMSLRGHVVRNLPGSMLDTLQDSGGSDSPTVFATQTRSELPLGAVVVGSARVKLEVRAEPLH
jgi:hypothetical protein